MSSNLPPLHAKALMGLHPLDQLRAVPVPRTEGAFGPFFSPDGQWIGFFAGNKLKKVSVAGGEPIDLCAAPNPYGGSWGTDGTIVFAADEGRRPTIVRDTGGVPRVVPLKDDRGFWSQDGKEIFYRNGNHWMTVAVTREPKLTLAAPHLLFEGPYVNVGGYSYSVTPDGKRFLVLEPAGQPATPVTHLNVVLNWFEEVQQKARR